MGTIYLEGICYSSGGGGGGASSADQVSLDDTNLAYEADDVQEAFEKVTKSLTYAEYQELTEEEKNNGTLYFITDVNGDGQSFQPVIYSEEEREIGVWTDGKPLYEKTLSAGSGITYGNITIPIGVDNIDKIAYAEAIAFLSSNNYLPLPRISSDSNYCGISAISTSNVVCYINRAFDGTVTGIYVTIRYTKTTDAAGSGVWTPQGVPAVHYSTDEQVVGTWIDGSTLYEKTYSVSSSVSIGTSWSDTGFELPANTNRVIEGFMYRNAQSGALMYAAFSINTSDHHLNAMLAIADTLDSGSSITIRYTKSST